MKKCRRCSKPAMLHITEIRKGEVAEIHLCESCASEYLAQAEMENENEAAPVEAGGEDDESDESSERGSTTVCPHCGITFREFRTSGRLGCPHDYDVFESELGSLLENIHGSRDHGGKVPKRAPDTSRRQHELIRLRSDLKVAIDAENYERAAELRDQIQALEAGLSSSSESPDQPAAEPPPGS